MPNATRLEWIGKYAAILSALVATTVGIGQYRRGVSQSIGSSSGDRPIWRER